MILKSDAQMRATGTTCTVVQLRVLNHNEQLAVPICSSPIAITHSRKAALEELENYCFQ